MTAPMTALVTALMTAWRCRRIMTRPSADPKPGHERPGRQPEDEEGPDREEQVVRRLLQPSGGHVRDDQHHGGEDDAVEVVQDRRPPAHREQHGPGDELHREEHLEDREQPPVPAVGVAPQDEQPAAPQEQQQPAPHDHEPLDLVEGRHPSPRSPRRRGPREPPSPALAPTPRSDVTAAMTARSPRRAAPEWAAREDHGSLPAFVESRPPRPGSPLAEALATGHRRRVRWPAWTPRTPGGPTAA